MSSCILSQNVIPTIHSMTGRTSRRLFKLSRNSSTFITLPDPVVASPSSLSGSQEFLRTKKFHDLKVSLSGAGNPSKVWSYYTSLLNILGYAKLPLEIHQEVLRRCTPSSAELRVSAAGRLEVGDKPSNPHIHEGRFQTIIRNIRALDMKPTLDDYHFILEQFAAVGHHVGAVHVYKELTHLGIVPRTKTYGLCLQAIAHRLTLPVLRADQSRRVKQARKMIADLMNDMRKFRIPFTSVNLDLTIRILKETSDMEGFESLMKWGYGIDLANPDRPPLEYLGVSTMGSELGVGEHSIPGLPTPQPFSTAALNTTIDMLGRIGNISKLVQAFEVLTQPLPEASQYLFSTFDDEDDFGVSDGLLPAFTPPHAPPNTTTYNMLLRHLCKAGHTVFARHYLLQAMWLDRQTDRTLRRAIRRQPLREVRAPHFAINRGTLLPAFGESNRDKNVGLMRWLSTKIPRVLAKKREDLRFYTELRERLPNIDRLYFERERLHSIDDGSSPPEGSSLTLPDTFPPPDKRPSTTPDATDALSLSTLRVGRVEPPGQRLPQRLPTGSVFDLDVDAPPAVSPTPVKYFNLDLHIRVLERDVAEIDSLSRHVVNVLGRTTQRLKERLGRRVWAGRDIYLLDQDRRQKVDRQIWRNIVGFQPRYGYRDSVAANSRLLGQRTGSLDRTHDITPRLSRRMFWSYSRPPRVLGGSCLRPSSIIHGTTPVV